MDSSRFLREGLGIDLDTTTLLYSSGPIAVRLFGLSLMSFIAARLVRRFVRRVEDPRTARQLEFFAPKIVRVLVVAVGLEFAGIDITGMAAVLTTVGFTGAVIFTPLGQNIVAGIITSIDDLFEIGDVIEVNGVYGTVLSRSLLRTELARPDGSTVWVPNKELSEDMTMNHSRLGGYRINVEIPLDHEPDRRRAVSDHEQRPYATFRGTWLVEKHLSASKTLPARRSSSGHTHGLPIAQKSRSISRSCSPRSSTISRRTASRWVTPRTCR